MRIVRKYAVKFEQWGIDEAFLDVTGRVVIGLKLKRWRVRKSKK